MNISHFSGEFTAPRAGVYLITFSYQGSNDANEKTLVYLYNNGHRMDETIHENLYFVG